MDKPIVHYKRVSTFPIEVGYSALVNALDHPNIPVDEYGEAIVRTSAVISVDSTTGDFETRNSRYVLVE